MKIGKVSRHRSPLFPTCSAAKAPQDWRRQTARRKTPAAAAISYLCLHADFILEDLSQYSTPPKGFSSILLLKEIVQLQIDDSAL